MKVDVQIPIEGIPYAYAKYSFDADPMSSISELHGSITEEIKSKPKNISTQNVLEVEEMKSLLQDTVEKSEMKSRLIESLKQAIGQEKYDEIREETVNSNEFKAITKHSKANAQEQ